MEQHPDRAIVLVGGALCIQASSEWMSSNLSWLSSPKELLAGTGHVVAEHSNVEPTLELKKSRRVPITESVRGGDEG